jgi:protein TonB
LPSHIQVLRGLGMGLDEEAVRSLKKYRFKPATEKGVPVTVRLTAAINFQIH